MLCLSLFVLTLLSVARGRQARTGDRNENSTSVRNDILDWEPPENFKTKYPYYLSGYDYENRPVIVLEWGKWFTRSVVEENGQELADLLKLQDLFVERLRTSFYRRPLNDSESGLADDEFVLLIDMKGYDLTQLTSSRNLKYLTEYFAKFNKSYEKFAYGFMINVTAVARQFVRLYNAFMARYIQRTEIHGTMSKRWIPRILKKIPHDQLPLKYGGTASFKPVAVYG